jgi:hypothetical protein
VRASVRPGPASAWLSEANPKEAEVYRWNADRLPGGLGGVGARCRVGSGNEHGQHYKSEKTPPRKFALHILRTPAAEQKATNTSSANDA